MKLTKEQSKDIKDQKKREIIFRMNVDKKDR